MPKLTDYKLLSFDIYGTLVDWDSGIVNALEPLLSKLPADRRPKPEEIIKVFDDLGVEQQRATPKMLYREILATIHAKYAAHLGVSTTKDEDTTFGNSIGTWPAWPDTVAALHRLKKHFKLVPLSNVDRASFSQTVAGPFQGFQFDKIITAEDVGAYKPDEKMFNAMLAAAQDEFGISRDEVLITARSQAYDIKPTRKMGLSGAWIARPSLKEGHSDAVYDFKFDTLAAMADAAEAES